MSRGLRAGEESLRTDGGKWCPSGDVQPVMAYVEQTVNVLEPEPRNPISITPVLKGTDLPP